MGKIQHNFMRIEKKFLLSEEQYFAFREIMEDMLIPDAYPVYSLRSLYYDTYDDLLIRRSLERPDYKEKLRIRSYQKADDNTTVFIEIKKKCAGIVGKRRISLDCRRACAYLDDGILPDIPFNANFREIEVFRSRYHPIPRMMIYYEREAFDYAQQPTVRITFDRNIIGSNHSLSLYDDIEGIPLLAKGYRLLEIKVPECIPLEIAHALSKLRIFPTQYSKYGSAYTYYLKQKENASCSTVSLPRESAAVSASHRSPLSTVQSLPF